MWEIGHHVKNIQEEQFSSLLPASGKSRAESTVTNRSKKTTYTMARSANADSASLNTLITAENDVDDWGESGDPFATNTTSSRKKRKS